MNKMRGVSLVLSLLALCGVCFGAGYDVGDAAGWTPGVDYKQWASTKSFHVGDSIDFRYNSAMHNVRQVTKEDYESCNTNNPLATFTSGLDTLTIQKPGHLFFICGIPGHCQGGMKVDIKVSDGSSSSPSPPTSPSQNPSSPGTDCPPAQPPPMADCPPAQPPPMADCPPAQPAPGAGGVPNNSPFGPFQPGSPFGPFQPGSPFGPFQPGPPFGQGQQQPKIDSAAASLNCFQLWAALPLSFTAFLLF